jgi:8-oxo-dGTP pyrophosphatase MutT (NUDIX family)
MTKITCSGGLFLSKESQRFLFLLRDQGRTAGTWGLVGGKQEPEDATAYQALEREISEEVGKTPPIKKVIPLELYTSEDQNFYFNTYVLLVDKEFIPTLNEEHVGYAWCDLNNWPKPLHQGVKRSLTSRINKTKIELILEILTDNGVVSRSNRPRSA